MDELIPYGGYDPDFVKGVSMRGRESVRVYWKAACDCDVFRWQRAYAGEHGNDGHLALIFENACKVRNIYVILKKLYLTNFLGRTVFCRNTEGRL